MLGYVWHFWIGVVLVAAVLLAMVGLLGYYMFSVEAKKHPSGKQRRHQDL
jgi:predicted negative regulator of RcsB-dependent stress response